VFFGIRPVELEIARFDRPAFHLRIASRALTRGSTHLLDLAGIDEHRSQL